MNKCKVLRKEPGIQKEPGMSKLIIVVIFYTVTDICWDDVRNSDGQKN